MARKRDASSPDMLSSLGDQLSDAVFPCDDKGRLKWFNEAFRKLLLSEGEILGRCLDGLLPALGVKPLAPSRIYEALKQIAPPETAVIECPLQAGTTPLTLIPAPSCRVPLSPEERQCWACWAPSTGWLCRELGCDFLQGNGICEAVPLEGLIEFKKTGPKFLL